MNANIMQIQLDRRVEKVKTFKISKFDGRSKKWNDYGGGYSEQDVKLITKGYKVDKEISECLTSSKVYTKRRCLTMFDVTEE